MSTNHRQHQHQQQQQPHAAMSISEQQLRIHQELTSVAYAHAPAFVDAVHSVQTAAAATNQCRSTSSALQQQLTTFKLSAQKLQESGAAWKKQRQLAAAGSSSLSKISELLDAPHTIESCIRSGMYHEALVAIQHVRGMCSSDRFRLMATTADQQQQQRKENSIVTTTSSSPTTKKENTIPAILQRISQEVDETVERLLTTFVLNQLAGSLVPSNALKIVIFLQSLAKQQVQEYKNYQNSSSSSSEQNTELLLNADQNNNNNSEEEVENSPPLSILATDPTALPELFLSLRSEFIANEMKDALMMSSSSSRNNSSSSSSSSFSCLQKMLAVYKVHVSESVATFKACFFDDQKQQQQDEQQKQQQHDSSSNHLLQLRDLLSRWSTIHTTKLISLFSLHVANLSSGADVAMLLEPVAQCGASLSKAGLDVSVVLESILVRRAEDLFLSAMEQASSSFVIALSAHRWRAVVEVSDKEETKKTKEEETEKKKKEGGEAEVESPADGEGTDQGEKTTTNTKKKETEEEKEKEDDSSSADAAAPPPMSLLRFPPLAHSMNSFLAGCNDVRKCALVAIRPRCLHAVCELISTLSSQLSSVRGSLLLEGPELESLRVMVKAFSNDFVPHVQKCTLRVFGAVPSSDVEWKKMIVKSVDDLQQATK